MKKIWKHIVILLLCTMLCSSVECYQVKAEDVNTTQENNQSKQNSQIPNERLLPRLVDDADLLDTSEEEELENELDEISERQQFDVVVVTVNSLEGKTPQDYADDFYDYNGYGYGSDHDGVLLLVSMEDRDWYMSTTGYGITAITDAGREYISDQFVPYLSDGEYLEAFETYANLCDEFVTQADTGEAYDSGNMPKGEYAWVLYLGIAIPVGVLIALIIVECMRRQLKSVRMQNSAANYVKKGTMVIDGKYSHFLYAQTTRRIKPEPSSSSSGSSTHVSSSGTTHGGGGGKF